MSRIVVYGASGHAKVVLDILERSGEYQVIGLLDDNVALWGRLFFGYEVLGGGEVLGSLKEMGVEGIIIGIGDNLVRDKWATLAGEDSLNLVLAVHPSAQISRGVTLGPGTAVMANAVINADSTIGENAIINTAATVDHDNHLGRCVHISPGAHLAGGVRVGDFTHIGTGAVVIPNITIGEHTVIAAGSVAHKDIPSRVVAAGSPAHIISKRAEVGNKEVDE